MDRSERAVMNGADIIVDFLIRQKVPYLFGLCGHGNVGFLDAAFKAQNRIRTISTHHEQSAGHMADAYFKVRNEPVATFTSCGPGSANIVMALAAAMMDSSAFFAITGNVPTSQFNRQPFQETGRHYQGDFPSVDPTLREAQLPADPGRHAAARGAPRVGADDVRPSRAGQSRRAVERIRGGGGGGPAASPRAGSATARRAAPDALAAALDLLLRGQAAGHHRRPGRAARRSDRGADHIRRPRWAFRSSPARTARARSASAHRAGVRLDRPQRHLCRQRRDQERRRDPGARLHLRRSRHQRLAGRLHACRSRRRG